MKKVCIGLQARSGSKRLPGKSLEYIEDMIMVEHCLCAAKTAAAFINQRRDRFNIEVNVCLLIPKGDPLKEALNGAATIVEGPEDDVLERYRLATVQSDADYIVRITGDCPLILSTLISKHILSSVEKKLDYCSNTFDDMRTMPDGYDCEVISRKLMDWLFSEASTKEEREHVTILAKSDPPAWARFGVVLGHNDFSDIKISVDTKEELDRVRANKASVKSKTDIAKDKRYYIFSY